MQPELVLGKTMKGIVELEQRSMGLSLVMRRVLIMIDGHRSVGALMHEQAGAFDVVATLEHLIALGLVAGPGVAAAAVADSAPGSAGAAGAGMPPGRSATTPCDALVNMAEALLGSAAAAKVVVKLRAGGDDPEPLRAAVDACVRLIRLTIDEAKAADFRRQADLILQRSLT
jgi:hypothetical protein